jgi:hypothetical protein
MSTRARYWTLHWIRALLWPLPALTLFRAGRSARHLLRNLAASSGLLASRESCKRSLIALIVWISAYPRPCGEYPD